ncbi:hypothetical protein ACF1HU_01445 [Streptomyces olivaceus]|uniref:hypothetical protein n=1 Tax=Streptomyces olivaceus TaxID=47716 RepID=UPI003701D3BB
MTQARTSVAIWPGSPAAALDSSLVEGWLASKFHDGPPTESVARFRVRVGTSALTVTGGGLDGGTPAPLPGDVD